ncbi:hypothetical protein WDU94_013620 [Cyamophila willieti]
MVSFRAMSTFFACAEFLHTGAAYSAAELQRARADVLRTFGLAPHLVPVSFLIMLFLDMTFFFVFSQCSL